jgi:formylglycine-generating enzyme required for sulfatase activity
VIAVGADPLRWIAAAFVLLAVGATISIGVARRGRDEGARCGPGFAARAARCVVLEDGKVDGSCPAPLESSSLGCDAPAKRVLVPEATIVVGPSDWEAEGRVAPRTIHVQAFRIDAFEVTRGRWGDAAAGDARRAASGMTRDEAASFCARQGAGARLPSEDEWIIAAVSGANPPPRYPWGDTGVVCRRAAWGLGAGPCARGADGPDTVGAHADGDSPLGLHDLAGNVAEWVVEKDASLAAVGIAKGGSWRSDLASDLRVWARLELAPDARDPRVGLRCLYPP